MPQWTTRIYSSEEEEPKNKSAIAYFSHCCFFRQHLQQEIEIPWNGDIFKFGGGFYEEILKWYSEIRFETTAKALMSIFPSDI